MRSLIPAFAIVLGTIMAAAAAPPATLTTLQAIHSLTNEDARQAHPVAFQATVTYIRGYEYALFVQDGDAAIYVTVNPDEKLVPGDRILIKGTVQPSFLPYVRSSSITLLHHGAVPRPLSVTYNQLINDPLDCRLVSVHAVVRSADLVLSADRPSTTLEMLSDGGSIEAVVNNSSGNALRNLLDAEVEVSGDASGEFDGKMQRVGIVLHVSSLADVKVLKHAGAGPWTLPITPMDQVFNGFRVYDSTQRFRVKGTITYYQPGSALVLQDGSRSLWISTQTRSPLKIDDVADVTGFPDIHSGFLALTRSEVQDTRVQASIAPLAATWKQLSSSANIFDLVSIEGQVVTEVREALQDEYVLAADGLLFTAVYRHPAATSLLPLPPMKEISVGSRVRVTGVCIPENSNPFDYDKAFNILLRSFGDITVIANPSWLSIRNLARTVIVLLLAVIAVGAWGAVMMRKAHGQTAALAARTEAEASLERRRSRILEDINGSRPLAEILEEITDMISFTLEGAPCWCEIADGARLGVFPPDQQRLRVVRTEISGRSGPPLGAIVAALNPLSRPSGKGPSPRELSAIEREALSAGAGLATLAIETRRLYDDLLHRSEFDQLTNTHNRASLDQQMDAQIENARQSAGIFGLIYIDLDDFKQINDVYGHQAGDLFLTEVARRMRQQLRPGDVLARLGGDEFAALVPVAHTRADVAEIALRLERSFDDPFDAGGCVLRGAASVGLALYPEDGSTKDSLLSAADAAMYVAKKTKRRIATMLSVQQEPDTTSKERP
jgi:diguanylate cyclase (GGDEF)-like protein